MKDALKKKFQTWYTAEIQEQLKKFPVDEVKVDLTAAAIKPKSASYQQIINFDRGCIYIGIIVHVHNLKY